MDTAARRRAIQSLDPQEFELLVHQLLAEEFPDRSCSKLRAPDQGADSLVRGEDGQVTQVVQCKRYPDTLTSAHWKECEDSLDAAVEHWEPNQVTFVFATDLSGPAEKHFQDKLVARKPDVQVDAITLTDLDRLSQKHEHVLSRFIGPDAKSLNETVRRATAMGGNSLEGGRDFVARAREIAAANDESDPLFRSEVASGGLEIPDPKWDELPYTTVEVQDQTHKVRFTSWVRDEADVGLPQLSFSDNDEGRAAKEHARQELAAGREPVLTNGVALRFTPSKAVRDLIGDPGPVIGTVRLPPPEPITVKVIAGPIRDEFEMRSVPPPTGAELALAVKTEALWFELNFSKNESVVTLNLTARASFGSSARENQRAAEFLLAVAEHEVHLEAPLLPNGGVSGAMGGRADESLREAAEVYGCVAAIEDKLGVQLPLPDVIETDDLQIIGTVCDILETGRGTATFEASEGLVSASDLARIDRDMSGSITRRNVLYELWGQTLDLGPADYEVPEVKVVKVIPTSGRPDAPARVTFAPTGDDQMPFRLVEPGN